MAYKFYLYWGTRRLFKKYILLISKGYLGSRHKLGVAYDLPNVSTVEEYAANKHEKRRRHRRDLYTRFESIMDSVLICGGLPNARLADLVVHLTPPELVCFYRVASLKELDMKVDLVFIEHYVKPHDDLVENPQLCLKNFYAYFFKFPLQYLSDEEPEEHKLYQSAYRIGRRNKQQQCSELFPDCPISLIDLALGYYSSYDKT
ncbi:hypothetical protein NQ317_016766 [Molorchus minor]|uniref:Uncharacterized protein n=1 Tax=Molorchus minor TaxID=1323400 RepID=A0ABQ9JLP4_9CUCU|nr:hypothetical protein NQ317_016766 [Molorchus minor]